MTIIECASGEEAPPHKPKVIAKARDDGRFEFCGVSDSLDIQLDARLFGSREEARAAAISWATAHNYGDIYLVTQDA